MSTAQRNLDAINDIKKIMERSSRFISLSGWSGVAAGTCALIGSFVAHREINAYIAGTSPNAGCPSCLRNTLVITASIVFIGALISAFVFTYLKSRKDGVTIWGSASKRLLFATLLPMAVGAVLIWKMINIGAYILVSPAALIFYGLALINGSKYTVGEVRYLGYGEIITGIASVLFAPSALYAWAFGFGILHIVYGIAMWWKHERTGE